MDPVIRNLEDAVHSRDQDETSIQEVLVLASGTLVALVLVVAMRIFYSIYGANVRCPRFLCPCCRPRTSPQQEEEGDIEASAASNSARLLLHRKATKDRRAIIESILCSRIVTSKDIKEWKQRHRECEISGNDCSESSASHEGCICSICIHDIEVGNVAVITNPCNHVFHKDCLTEWLVVRNIFCPYCRNRDIITLEAVLEATQAISSQRRSRLEQPSTD